MDISEKAKKIIYKFFRKKKVRVAGSRKNILMRFLSPHFTDAVDQCPEEEMFW